MKIIAAQLEAGQQVTTAPGLGVWRFTGASTFATTRAEIEAAGGSRRVTLPHSTLRIGDVVWQEVRDVAGQVVAWRRSINGVPCYILNSPSPKENEMTKKKRDHGTAMEPKPVTYTLPEPTVEAPKAPEKVKALDFLPQDTVKASRAGTKVSILVDLLSREQGATLTEVAEALSVTGSKVDLATARSWIRFDLKARGYGIRTVDDRIHLVLPDGMTSPPAHLDAKTTTKAPAIAIVESEPIVKKAAKSKESKKSKRAAR